MTQPKKQVMPPMEMVNLRPNFLAKRGANVHFHFQLLFKRSSDQQRKVHNAQTTKEARCIPWFTN